jgi:hypothetical protein
MKLGRILSLAVVAAGLVLMGSESRATSISLPTTANLLAGNTVAFSPPATTFSFTAVTASGTAAPVLTGITAAPLSPVGAASNTAAVPPFGFALNGSVVSAAQGQTSDLLVQYTVTSAVPILQLELSAVGSATPGALALISETITNQNNVVQTLTLNGGGTVFLTLAPGSTSLAIGKDINANATGAGAGGGASYSSVSNLIITAVPEPASVVMLGCGLIGAFGLGLRRTKKVA